MLPELTQDEFSAALDEIAHSLLLMLGEPEPPIDAIELAHSLGMNICWDSQQAGRGRIVRLGAFDATRTQASILLRPDPRPERLQWAVAHEIGELSAVQVFDRLGVDPREAPTGARETVANQLAGRVLLPRASFLENGRRLEWDLFELKSRFATASHELIARRMLDFAPPVTITIFDHGRRTFRRANTPGRIPGPSPLETSAWQKAHDTGRGTVETDFNSRVQAWPIHEPQWKREILRTEWQTSEWQAMDDCATLD